MNTAITNVTGNYAWFINAGDIIEKNNFNRLIKNIAFSTSDLHFFSVIIKSKNGKMKTKKYL